MASLADLFAINDSITLDGLSWRVRPPNQIEHGQFSRWLERRDRENARRADEDDADQEKLLRFTGLNSAECRFEWGSDSFCAALGTPFGVAQMLQFIIANEKQDQPVPPDIGTKIVARKLGEIAILLMAETETDPQKKSDLLRSVGFPPDFQNSSVESSSPSPIHHSESPSQKSEN